MASVRLALRSAGDLGKPQRSLALVHNEPKLPETFNFKKFNSACAKGTSVASSKERCMGVESAKERWLKASLDWGSLLVSGDLPSAFPKK